MVVKLSQQYNVGEKSTVILCTYINRYTGTPDKKQKQKQKQYSTTPDMASTWYLNGFSDGSNLGVNNIMSGRNRYTVHLY